MKKRVIAIIGESGTGKDSLINELVGDSNIFHRIVPCTTRPPRENEINGI